MGLVSGQNWLGPGSATWKGFRTFHGWVNPCCRGIDVEMVRWCDVVRWGEVRCCRERRVEKWWWSRWGCCGCIASRARDINLKSTSHSSVQSTPYTLHTTHYTLLQTEYTHSDHPRHLAPPKLKNKKRTCYRLLPRSSDTGSPPPQPPGKHPISSALVGCFHTSDNHCRTFVFGTWQSQSYPNFSIKTHAPIWFVCYLLDNTAHRSFPPPRCRCRTYIHTPY